MFDMFNTLSFLSVSKADREMFERTAKERLRRRIESAVPWEPNTKFQDELNIKGDTFKSLSLWDVAPIDGANPNSGDDSQLVISPEKQFCYCEKILPAGASLNICSGSRKGSVIFDTPVVIPALHSRDHHCKDRIRWNPAPWMSITPMEIITLRPGTKAARGDVIVAGLGLGHQLIEVSKKKSVKSIRLVEISEELVNWVMPRIKPYLEKPVEVVIGRAIEVMPDMKADVALIDVFKNYGNNNWARQAFVRECKGIDKIWAWGSARI